MAKSDSNGLYELTTWGESVRDFTTPSGQTCQIRVVSIETLAELGILDQLDVLTNSVSAEIIAPARGKKPQDHQKKAPTKAEIAAAEEAVKSSEGGGIFGGFTLAQIIPLIDVINRAVCEIVVQPPIQRPVRMENGEEVALKTEEREQGIVYTDTIPLNDRTMLFNTSFGDISALASFRDGSNDDVGDVADE